MGEGGSVGPLNPSRNFFEKKILEIIFEKVWSWKPYKGVAERPPPFFFDPFLHFCKLTNSIPFPGKKVPFYQGKGKVPKIGGKFPGSSGNYYEPIFLHLLKL